MGRAFLIVMDTVGIGGAPDAGAFFDGARPDTGANTLAHIVAAHPLAMPHRLGAALERACGERAPGLGAVPEELWGAATEVSPGKDTPTGYWGRADVPLPWTTFPDHHPALPPDLSAAIAQAAGTAGILGDCHASGTEILARLGAQHLRTGWPIVYTSVDRVVQIAAHEQVFGLARPHALCAAIAPRVHALRVGRVIARPFTGAPGAFPRTPNRRDWAIAPPAPMLLDVAARAGRGTHAIGKIGDIFSHRGITHLHKGASDADLARYLLRLSGEAEEGSLTFANFVEFDSLWGHRRDALGYARALEWFDGVAGALMVRLRPGDLAIFIADPGNDPIWPGTDHTRERVPVLGWGVGPRATGQVGFADIGASVAAHLGLRLAKGIPFL